MPPVIGPMARPQSILAGLPGGGPATDCWQVLAADGEGGKGAGCISKDKGSVT